MAIERRRTSASSGVRSGTRTPYRTDVRRTLPVGPGPADGHLPYHPPLRGRVGACVPTSDHQSAARIRRRPLTPSIPTHPPSTPDLGRALLCVDSGL